MRTLLALSALTLLGCGSDPPSAAAPGGTAGGAGMPANGGAGTGNSAGSSSGGAAAGGASGGNSSGGNSSGGASGMGGGASAACSLPIPEPRVTRTFTPALFSQGDDPSADPEPRIAE